MSLEDRIKPGMTFAAICRLLEGWVCARFCQPGARDPAGTQTWDFTDRLTGQTIRGTFDGGKLLIHGEPASGSAGTDQS
jgi:hypothetical protein